MMIKRELQREQWKVLDRLRSVACPVDYEDLPNPLHLFAEPRATQWLTMPSGEGLALGVRIVASAAITICRFRLRIEPPMGEISWLEPCKLHPYISQKSYSFHECSSGSAHFLSENVLNHRTLHRGMMKRGGFMSGYLLGTFVCARSSKRCSVRATLSIEDLFEHEYQFPIQFLGDTSESDN
jgi:hypothetical protein